MSHKIECNNFIEYDLLDFIKNFQLGKAIGCGSIGNKMYKYGVSFQITDLLLYRFNNMVRFGVMPDDFNISLVTPIPKKDKNE